MRLATLTIPVKPRDVALDAPFAPHVLRKAAALTRWDVQLRAEPGALVITGAPGVIWSFEHARVEVAEILYSASELHRLVRRLEAVEPFGVA